MPAVEPVPSYRSVGGVYTTAIVVDVAPSAGAPAVFRGETIAAARDRVLINDVDFTYYGGSAVQVGTFKLIDPLLYGSAEITLPGINPQFPHPDLGTQKEMRGFFQFAPVKIQRVLDGAVVATDYKGFVSRVDMSGTTLTLTVGGEAAGALSQMYVPETVYRSKQNIDVILVDMLRDARASAEEMEDPPSFGLIKRGSTDGLTLFNEYVAIWSGSSGQMVTYMPGEDGVYRKSNKPGAAAACDGTVYPSPTVTINLQQDFAEQFTRVFAHGTTEQGELVSNVKVPGGTQGTPPAFPGTLMLGDTGDDVLRMQYQLHLHNFLNIDDDDVTLGTFDDATASAVVSFKEDAGLDSLTPEVGEPAWTDLFDLEGEDSTLTDAREYPMAQRSKTRKWNRTINGARKEANPDYDPDFIPNDLFIDVGGPFRRGQIKDFAKSKLAPPEGVWMGEIVFRSGLVKGEHSIGDPLTTDDIMDRRDLLPNMKLLLPWFQTTEGTGLEVYVNYADHSADQTTCYVSSVPQTTMEAWQAKVRRKESKSNLGRSIAGHTRASQVRNDIAYQWDTSSGWLAIPEELAPGEWTQVEIFAGQAGVVQRILTVLSEPVEYAIILTQQALDMTWLNGTSRISTPLTDPRPSARPWYEVDAIMDVLEDKGVLYSWGTENQPCGYGRTMKTDDLGDTGQDPNGRFMEIAGFNYETGVYPVLYLYIWIPDGGPTTYLEPGRVLRNQRTTDL